MSAYAPTPPHTSGWEGEKERKGGREEERVLCLQFGYNQLQITDIFKTVSMFKIYVFTHDIT